MTPQVANVAIQFLSRVNLNAEEIPAFMAVKQSLEEIASQPEEGKPELQLVRAPDYPEADETPPWDEPEKAEQE